MKKRRSVAAAPAARPTLEAALARRSRMVIIAIVLVSAAIRAVYFQELNSGPLIALDRLDQSDMAYYADWGGRIADGDWRSASIAVPMHGWHREVARQYLADHPDDRRALEEQASQSGTDAGALLWARWTNGRQFYQDPLYPYLIGITRRVAGPDVRIVFAWQMLLGIGSNVLVWLLARRFFGEVTALIAAAFAVFCGPIVYYDLILLRESSIVFATLGLAWLIDRAFAIGGAPRFAALGAALGFAFLLKSTLLVIALGVGIALAMRTRRTGFGATALAASALAAGFASALIPLAIRNVSVGLPPFTMASGGALTFAVTNDVAYPVEAGFDINPPQLARIMGDTNGRLLPAVAETMRAHTVGSFATLLWRKWDRLWHWVEIPNNEDFYYMRLQAPVLAWLPVTAWILAPLGLVGLVLAWPRRRDLWPLYLMVAATILPMIVFYVLGRFRVPLLALLAPFASFTLVRCAGWLRGGAAIRAFATAAIIVATLIFWTGRAPLPTQPLIRPTDWLAPYLISYRTKIQRAQDVGDIPRTIAAFEAFFRYEPEPWRLMSSADREIANFFGRMHADCATLLRQSGHADEAQVHMAQADRYFGIAGR